jgi:hypothetical protein
MVARIKRQRNPRWTVTLARGFRGIFHRARMARGDIGLLKLGKIQR